MFALASCTSNGPDRSAAIVRVPARLVPADGFYAPAAPDTANSFILGRDARGLVAFSNRCTRTPCIVDPPVAHGAPSVCRCHGAEYDDDGDAILTADTRSDAGYAPLRHYPIVVEGSGADAVLAIDTLTEQTDRNARVPAP